MKYLFLICINCIGIFLFSEKSNAQSQAAPPALPAKTITAPAEQKPAVPAEILKQIVETDNIPAARKAEVDKAEKEAYKLPPGAPANPATKKPNSEKKKEGK